MNFSSSKKLQLLPPSDSLWRLDQVAGRFVEISSTRASAALTLTFSLIGEAQERGEPVVGDLDARFFLSAGRRPKRDRFSRFGGGSFDRSNRYRAGWRETFALRRFRFNCSRSRCRRYCDAFADALDRPCASSSYGVGLSDEKKSRRVFFGIIDFAPGSRPKKTRGAESLRVRFAHFKRQTARPHVES